MVLYRVFSEPHLTKYYSTIFSRATVFQIIIYTTIVIAPFFIAHSTNEFWQYSSTYREQPQIHFLNQWILQVNSDTSPVAKTWSTFQGFNGILQEDTVTPVNSEIAIPVVKFREEDYNYDRVNDRLTLTAVYSQLEYNITAIQALLFFEIQLNSYSSVTMTGLIHISNSWSLPSSRHWVAGDVLINQRDPFPSSGRFTNYNITFFNDTSLQAKDYELIAILRNYHQRNITVTLGNSYTQWEAGTNGDFTFQVELTYPIQTLLYTPNFWQVIKFAWIQYLAVLIVFYVVLSWVQSFVFQNQIILTVQHRTDRRPHQH